MHYKDKSKRIVALYSYTEIIKRIAEKDPVAVTLLYERYGRQLYQYALQQWSMDEDSAWEVIYQTLERLQQRLLSYSFDSQAMFDRLVFKVFLNFLRQRYRKDNNVNRVITVPLSDIYPDESENEIDEDRQSALAGWLTDEQKNFYEQDEGQSLALLKLQQALESLDPIERDLLLLRAQGFSYDDIANMLGIVNNQLKVKHLRAKKKLMTLINQLV